MISEGPNLALCVGYTKAVNIKHLVVSVMSWLSRKLALH